MTTPTRTPSPVAVALTSRATRTGIDPRTVEAFAAVWARNADLAADPTGAPYLPGGIAMTAEYLADAAAEYVERRAAEGLSATAPAILKAGDRLHKFDRDLRALVYVLSLAPWTLSGYNVCPKATPYCAADCVGLAGRGSMPGTVGPRVVLTRFAAESPDRFTALMVSNLNRAERRAGRAGLPLALRLNNYSDQHWHRLLPWIADAYPAVTFYGYTKRRDIARHALNVDNVDVTWSVSARDKGPGVIGARVREVGRAAVIFPADAEFPATIDGFPVVDGDRSDLRHLDGVCVVGLHNKGRHLSGDARRPEDCEA